MKQNLKTPGRTAAPRSVEISILAGGLSSRIGRNKALLRLGRRTLLEHVRTSARDSGWPHRVIRRDLVPEETASFLIAMVEGYEVLAKNAQDVKLWNEGITNIVGWLQSLRAPRQAGRGGRWMLKKPVAKERRRIRVRRKR